MVRRDWRWARLLLTHSGSHVCRLGVFSRAEEGVLGVQVAGPLLLGARQGIGPSPPVSQGAAAAAMA